MKDKNDSKYCLVKVILSLSPLLFLHNFLDDFTQHMAKVHLGFNIVNIYL